MKTVYLQNGETLRSALKKAEKGDTLVLENKDYREKVVIDVAGITIVGGGEKSRIIYDDYATKIHDDGQEYNTFRTFTVIVTAKNVTLKNLTIENDAGEQMTKQQEVALSVYADGFFAQNVTLKSLQDTLFCGPLPDDLITRYIDFLPYEHRYFEGRADQLFLNCKIIGTVDYVFGCGTAYFLDCDLISVAHERPVGYVVAPAHSLKQKKGFTFINCRFLKDGDFESELYLARPWRDYGKATFINCKHQGFDPRLFDRWNDTIRNRTARFEVYDLPDSDGAVDWIRCLSAKEVKKYLSSADNLLEKFQNRD